jgi:hypothetical protein
VEAASPLADNVQREFCSSCTISANEKINVVNDFCQ